MSKKLDFSKVATIEKHNYSKEELKILTAENVAKMSILQEKLFASGEYGILVILQGMDTSGKDSCIKSITNGINPAGCKVFSFKKPSIDEISHDYLWRANLNLPKLGEIVLFNRSYYEDVLVVQVHNLLKPIFQRKEIWKERYLQINNYERYLRENNVIPVKFFLHISKEEQKKRLLQRLKDENKNWKFEPGDLEERKYWEDYQECYADVIENTEEGCNWKIIPADDKYYARYLISSALLKEMEKLNITFPERKDKVAVKKYIDMLENEK